MVIMSVTPYLPLTTYADRLSLMYVRSSGLQSVYVENVFCPLYFLSFPLNYGAFIEAFAF